MYRYFWGEVLASKDDPNNLAVRNLLRGMSMCLPSGQDVARAMGLKPIEDENLRICKAALVDWNAALIDGFTMKDFQDHAFAGRAPLWYYVLAEAQYEWAKRATTQGSKGDEEPVTLGPVGGRIVAETLIGLLWADGHSYLRQAPNWTPADSALVGDGQNFDMGKLIAFAQS